MSGPRNMKSAVLNFEAEAVWGDGTPTEQRMEEIACQGYFPFLNWEFFRWAYPAIEFSTATEMFLSSLHWAIEGEQVYVTVPPHVTDPEVGTKQIGNIIAGKRAEYWKAGAHEVVSYFQTYWPQSDIRGQALADHQSLNWPYFCFPMSAENYDPLNKHPEIDWNDCFMFP